MRACMQEEERIRRRTTADNNTSCTHDRRARAATPPNYTAQYSKSPLSS